MTPDDFPNHSSYMTYVTMCEKALEEELKKDLYNPHKDLYEESSRFPSGEQGIVYTMSRGSVIASHTVSPLFTIKSDVHPEDHPCVLCSPEDYYGNSSREVAHKVWLEHHESVCNAYYQYYFIADGLPVPPYEPDKNGAHP